MKWRHGDGTGYQPRFEKLLREGYSLDVCNLESYFDAAQILHSARFSYGERIAVLEERVGDTLSLASYYARFTERLAGDAHPWEDPTAIALKDAPSELMDRFVQQLSAEERTIARGVLSRLVRPAGKHEGKDAQLVCPAADLPAVAGPLIPRLERAKIITIAATNGNAVTIQLASEEILRDWSTLRDWIDGDRDFLLWRDSLRKPLDEYRRNPVSISAVDPALIAAGTQWLYSRIADLTAAEIEFVLAAIEEYRGRSARLLCSQAASELQRSATAESTVRSALLAAESLRRLHTVEGDQIVRDALAAIPPLLAKLENADAICFLGTRADRKFVACATGTEVRFWLDPESTPNPLTFHFERPIVAMASSADAGIIATCDDDGTICIIREFGLPSPVAKAPPGNTYIEFDYEDRLLAIPPAGGVFRVDAETGTMLPVMPLNGPVTMRRSSVDRRLFCAAAEGASECRVWHAGDPGTAQRIPIDEPCSTAAFSHDNRQIAIAMAEGERETVVTVFDLETLTPVATHRLADRLDRLIFSPGDLGIVAVTGGRTAQILPVRIKTTAWRSRVDSDVNAAAANAPAGLLALGGTDGVARLIDFSTGREVMRADHGAPIRIVRFNANGEHLVTAGEDRSVCIWDVRGLRESLRINHAETVWDLQFHPSGTPIVTVGNDQVQAVELPGGEQFRRFGQFGRSACSAAFSPDGKKLAVTLTNGQADVLCWPGGENVARHFHKRTATCCAFSPDGVYLATGGLDGRVLLIPQTGDDPPAEFQHPDSVWDVRFSPQGEWLVSGDERGVRIWNTASKTLFRQILLPAACHACLYAPDGESIIAACDDGVCRILTAYGAEDRSIPNGSRINCVAVAPDGRYIAMGSDDAVKIWSLTADRQIAHIRYEGEVQWLAFSPDARHLAVASSDATARLWLWQTNDLMEEVRRRVRRTLTTEEWLQALPSEAPPPTDSEPELSKLVSRSEMRCLISLSRATKETVALSEHTYDDLCRLAAFGLIRSRSIRAFQGITLNQAVRIESFFDLTPKGREFLRRRHLQLRRGLTGAIS